MNIFKPDNKDPNKIFRNVMLSMMFFYMIITTVILVSLFFDKDFSDFSAYFLSISTVLIASMTNYFYFVSKKEIRDSDRLSINCNKKDNNDLL